LYLTSEHAFDTDAMTAWTEAQMNFYANRDGKCPMLSGKTRIRKIQFGFR
jgi:hypothetical protein